jgi:hypothetical protein
MFYNVNLGSHRLFHKLMLYSLIISSNVLYIHDVYILYIYIYYIYYMPPHRIKERTSHLFDHFIDYKMMSNARVCMGVLKKILIHLCNVRVITFVFLLFKK